MRITVGIRNIWRFDSNRQIPSRDIRWQVCLRTRLEYLFGFFIFSSQSQNSSPRGGPGKGPAVLGILCTDRSATEHDSRRARETTPERASNLFFFSFVSFFLLPCRISIISSSCLIFQLLRLWLPFFYTSDHRRPLEFLPFSHRLHLDADYLASVLPRQKKESAKASLQQDLDHRSNFDSFEIVSY